MSGSLDLALRLARGRMYPYSAKIGSGSPTKPRTSGLNTDELSGIRLAARWLFIHWAGGGSPVHAMTAPTKRTSTGNLSLRFRRRCMLSRRRLVVSQSSISSNNRESCRATATVNNMRASGSIAQSSKPATFAETPTWAHWRHANSRNPCRALSLSSEISIFDTQSAKSFPEHHAVTRRWILSQRPACRRGKFRRARMKSPEIRLVATVRLINHGEELEVDLVYASGEVHGKRPTVAPRHYPGHEFGWQAPPQQIGRAGVQPVPVEIEVSCYAIPCRPQRLR